MMVVPMIEDLEMYRFGLLDDVSFESFAKISVLASTLSLSDFLVYYW